MYDQSEQTKLLTYQKAWLSYAQYIASRSYIQGSAISDISSLLTTSYRAVCVCRMKLRRPAKNRKTAEISDHCSVQLTIYGTSTSWQSHRLESETSPRYWALAHMIRPDVRWLYSTLCYQLVTSSPSCVPHSTYVEHYFICRVSGENQLWHCHPDSFPDRRADKAQGCHWRFHVQFLLPNSLPRVC